MSRRVPRADETLAARVARAAHPLATAADLDPLLARIGDARFVLLGEATHGTHEFYAWRDAITRRLVTERGFSIVAVEGDWPDCHAVDRWIRGYDGAGEPAETVLHAFERWPTWMWANRETAALVDWLRAHNAGRPYDEAVGFHGLDVYSLWDSMRAVVRYLDEADPAAARQARRAYGCFDPYAEDEQEYAAATASAASRCEDEAVAMLRALREHAAALVAEGRDAYFSAEQNALVVRNAERYYRTMLRGGGASWNVRDRHMLETLDRLVAHRGPHAKAVVWAHNTHVGDARFTDMRRQGMVNLGQLAREAHGERPDAGDGVCIVGFGTHRGEVIAGAGWGEPMARCTVPAARHGSWEDTCHLAGEGRDLLLVLDGSPDGGIAGLDAWRDHRAIGVVYDPARERWGNYVPTQVARRYDAFLHVDVSRALAPLHWPVPAVAPTAMETFPSGM